MENAMRQQGTVKNVAELALIRKREGNANARSDYSKKKNAISYALALQLDLARWI